MIDFAEAARLILENVEVLDTVDCAIEDAVGQVLAEDIVSPIDVTPFRNSAMDGFAVRAAWLTGCSAAHPVTMQYHDTIHAGAAPDCVCTENSPVKVMTGAPVPKVLDAVVKFEDTTYDDRQVVFHQSLASGTHLRLPGQDISRGQRLFAAGYRLRVFDIGMLAGIGRSHVSVHRRPSVLIAVTGNELVQPGGELAGGKIYNSNLYTASALVSAFCGEMKKIPAVPDEPAALEAVLRGTQDVIITTGGVSAGDKDIVIAAAEQVGWQTVFHKVKVKPGKPLYFARRGKRLLFGLPGNPLSVAVSCIAFVLPALKKMIGRQDYSHRRHPARLGSTPPRKCNRLLIWPGTIVRNEGEVICEFSPKTLSACLSALKDSDGLIFQHLAEQGVPQKIEYLKWEDVLN